MTTTEPPLPYRVEIQNGEVWVVLARFRDEHLAQSFIHSQPVGWGIRNYRVIKEEEEEAKTYACCGHPYREDCGQYCPLCD